MKKLITIITLFCLSYTTFADKVIRGVDIINNTKMPLTVMYVTACHSVPQQSEGDSSTVCDKEETIELSAKNTVGSSTTIIAPISTSANTLQSIYIKKITSQFGDQEFAVADGTNAILNELYQRPHYGTSVSVCMGYSGVGAGGPQNMAGIILDNYGTDKIYCMAPWLSR